MGMYCRNRARAGMEPRFTVYLVGPMAYNGNKMARTQEKLGRHSVKAWFRPRHRELEKRQRRREPDSGGDALPFHMSLSRSHIISVFSYPT